MAENKSISEEDTCMENIEKVLQKCTEIKFIKRISEQLHKDKCFSKKQRDNIYRDISSKKSDEAIKKILKYLTTKNGKEIKLKEWKSNLLKVISVINGFPDQDLVKKLLVKLLQEDNENISWFVSVWDDVEKVQDELRSQIDIDSSSDDWTMELANRIVSEQDSNKVGKLLEVVKSHLERKEKSDNEQKANETKEPVIPEPSSESHKKVIQDKMKTRQDILSNVEKVMQKAASTPDTLEKELESAKASLKPTEDISSNVEKVMQKAASTPDTLKKELESAKASLKPTEDLPSNVEKAMQKATSTPDTLEKELNLLKPAPTEDISSIDDKLMQSATSTLDTLENKLESASQKPTPTEENNIVDPNNNGETTTSEGNSEKVTDSGVKDQPEISKRVFGGEKEKSSHKDMTGKQKGKSKKDKEIEFKKPREISQEKLKEDSIKIYAVLAKGSFVAEEGVFCLNTKLAGESAWEPLRMNFDQRFQTYFIILPLPENASFIEYKYCITLSSNQYKWEGFLNYGGVYTNRRVQFSKDRTNLPIVYDVVNLQNYSISSWKEMSVQGMEQYLPLFHTYDPSSEKENNLVVGKEILSWTRQLKRGWEITGYFSNTNNYNNKIDDMICKWLHRVSADSDGNKHNISHNIMLSLFMTVGLYKNNHNPNRELIEQMCASLSTSTLNAEEQKCLYMGIQKVFGNGCITDITDTFHALWRRQYDVGVVVESLLLLPLYWLVSYKGEIRNTVVNFDKKHPFIYGRTSLPNIPHYAWTALRYKCDIQQKGRKLYEMADEMFEISKVHPWIIQTYQYFLTESYLLSLIENREKHQIAFHFPLDSVFYQLLHQSNADLNKVKDISDFLLTSLSKLIEDAKTERFSSEETSAHQKSANMILQSICDYIVKMCKNYYITKGYYDDILWCLNIAELAAILSMVLTKKLDDGDISNSNKILKKILSMLTRVIKKTSVVDKEVIKFWNSIMACEWEDEDLKKMWNEQILSEIKVAINEFWPHNKNENFLKYYVTEMEDMSLGSELGTCFNKKADVCTEELLRNLQVALPLKKDQKSWYMKGRIGWLYEKFTTPRFIKIFESLFTRELSKHSLEAADGRAKVINFFMQWSFAVQFYHLFYNDEYLAKFSSDAKKRIEEVADELQNVVVSLHSCDIQVKHLQLVVQKKWKFCQIWDALNFGESSSSVDMSQANLTSIIEELSEQLEVFQSVKKWVNHFIQICDQIDEDGLSINIDDLNAKLERNLTNLKISEIFSPKTANSSALERIQFFGASCSDLSELQCISLLGESQVFLKIWKRNAKNFMDEFNDVGINDNDSGLCCISWKEVLADIWQTTKNQLLHLIFQIDKGSLTLQEVSMWFHGNANIEQEMKILYSFQEHVVKQINGQQNDKEEDGHEETSETSEDEDVLQNLKNLHLRTKQIINLFKLEESEEAVDKLLNLKQQLGLNGDFEAIEIQKEISHNRDYSPLTGISVEQNTQAVFGITQKELGILDTFMEKNELTGWLKKKMKDMKEVKVMCDLAMISAGDSPYEVSKVSCLLSAVMGFAPLIFDLGQKVGLTELLEKCKQVWKNVEADDKLIKKWEDTNQWLSWFKELADFHGSVEKLSLTRAQDINERGIYTIKRTHDDIVPTIESCIKLTIPAKTEADKKQELSLNQLQDLQSRLMLIAGDAEKGHHDVTRFVEVLTSVQTLATTYVTLVKSGCMLFSNWSAVIICKDISVAKTTDYLQIQVRFDDDSEALTGTGSFADLNKLTNILNQALERWNKYISMKRMEHYSLNEFNIQQTIYLCHELALCEYNDSISDQVYTLLSVIANNLRIGKIKDTLEQATRIQEEDQDLNNNRQGAIDETDTEENEINILEKKKQVVRILVVEDEIDEDVAKAAVQAEGPGDLANCRLWTLTNGFDDDLVQEFSEKFDEECGFAHQEAEVQVVHSVLYERSENTLKDVLVRLQEKIEFSASVESLLNAVNTICTGYYDETKVITLHDYMSIEHLGRFLKLLQDKAEGRPLCRNLMPPLQEGKPNLLICLEHEILPTALSLYMHNKKEMLPSNSEVLNCTDQTSVDEVERFMRRVMCNNSDQGQRLFTLAFADKLSFNVSAATEKIFNVLSQNVGINEKYQLVILLSKQQHYIATCFDKYLVEGKWASSSLDIASYLKKHLQVEDPTTSAACVDKDHSNVKVISSARSGVGKSLHVCRLKGALQQKMQVSNMKWQKTTIRLLEKNLNPDYVIERLYKATHGTCNEILFIHLDLTPAVQHGIETFVFNLFVLGSIQDSQGKIWKRHPSHYYVIEVTDCLSKDKARFTNRHILNLLPHANCFSPREILLKLGQGDKDFLGMDIEEFQSDTFQRPYQYLSKYEMGQDLDSFFYCEPSGNAMDCIQVLLRHCCMENPSWAQLRHFSSFLNVQLQNCENSVFCDLKFVGDILRGLKAFAVKFMIRMSQDFATPSLNISDESSADHVTEAQGQFQIHQIRRKWEESSHPYIFFNEDHHTMTFINVRIDPIGNLLNKNGTIAEERIIRKQLVHGLKLQGVNLNQNFDQLTREKKLEALCQVMGIEQVFDPDPTYELTTDNVLKILAIYMRFRCQIPVIIMGETGCGKTRMVEFISRLKAGPKMEIQVTNDDERRIKNMITLKIHGGITVSDIYESVREAQRAARELKTTYNLSTILFYDEANTTEAIYAIKEVMCDLTIDGKSFQESQLQLVAACNPYKQLSKEAIKKLEDSGLGYRIRTSETTHLFGNIPMRTLVYRVVALPPSMQPFVWDFGQLGDDAERVYIEQMTKKLAEKLQLSQTTLNLINMVLSRSQSYMRSRKNECRYVSLRDVERSMTTFEWFHNHSDSIYPLIEEEIKNRYIRTTGGPPAIDRDIRTLLQTVGICYHASLDDRVHFRENLSALLNIEGVNEMYIQDEFTAAQTVFLANMEMDDNIACNEALQENVFMMTVCADMRIPLFLIGKPGSSKSLAKTIVTNNMQGGTSRSPLYQKLKQIHILSYQCSALTDAVGIKSVFKQCSQLQANQDLEAYTAVVVLDEIGLAEDSANMPLKVLHPLLESGSTEGVSLTSYDPKKKVGFVGISNWALDPAKMNRGIFVTRNKPSKEDLKATAKGIFKNQRSAIRKNADLLDALTETYLEIYTAQEVEYFGLRDYYSLIKMIHALCTLSTDDILFEEVANAVLRNFSGGREDNLATFWRNLMGIFPNSKIPKITIQRMIGDNLREKESRFLLLLTHDFSAVSLLHLCIKDFHDKVQVVFGSSFPGDHNYTQICRNINRIKVCMETGQTVVLLNMTEIHESLYDALNQHYVTFGGQKFVDLGLGGHRVKCRIADDFRLIVIEQKEVVYDEYPIPLINRLEKHHFNSDSLLSQEQKEKSLSLSKWIQKFSEIQGVSFGSPDAFVGFNDDTASSVVLTTPGDVEAYKHILLQSCAMDAIFRLPESNLGGETEALQERYIVKQCHDSLLSLLKNEIENFTVQIPFMEITSYSNILSEKDREEIEVNLGLIRNSVMLLSLEQFQTEQEYTNKVDEFFKRCQKEDAEGRSMILLIQCAQAQSRDQLIACAKHGLLNKIREFMKTSKERKRGKVIIGFLLSTERESKGKSRKDSLILQHTGDHRIIYVDELRPTNNDIAPASYFYQKSLCDILHRGKEELDSGTIGDSMVNIQILLKDCITEAITKVKFCISPSDRYFERIRMLTDLCCNDDNSSMNFRKILLAIMVKIYREREDLQQNSFKDWIVAEACNHESLQEGGTFCKTLWLCLKHHVSRLFAYILSVIDRNNNLDLLVSENTSAWKSNMWLEMFKVLPFQWSDMIGVEEFSIKRSLHFKFSILGKIPFSFQITDFLTGQWETVQNQYSPDKYEIFQSLFHKSDMFQVVARAFNSTKGVDLMRSYVSDLVKNSYVPGTDKNEELHVIEETIFQLSLKRYTNARQMDIFTMGDQISLIFLVFQDSISYLKELSKIFKACPEVLKNADDWMKEQEVSDHFMIHILAFKDVLHILTERASQINNPKICLQWKDLATASKHIFNSMIDLVNEQVRNDIMKVWIPLSLLDLLILQLIPSTSQVEIFKNYLNVIAPHAKLLWKGSERADLRSKEFLIILTNVLKKFYDDIHLRILLLWSDSNCKLCRKKVKNPTFLPCGHFVCKDCIAPLMASSRNGGKCPQCLVPIPEDFHPQVATMSKTQTMELEHFKSNCTSFFLEYLQQFCFVESHGQKCVPTKQMEPHTKLLLKEIFVQMQDVGRKELKTIALDLNINTKSCILHLLLLHNYELVLEELDKYLLHNDGDLVTVIIKCFEQKLGDDCMSKIKADGKYEHCKQLATNAWDKHEVESTPSKLLQTVVKMRYALTEFASCINDTFRETERWKSQQMEEFMSLMIKICKEDDLQILREFVIKVGCHNFGTEWFYKLAENVDFSVLVPEVLLDAEESTIDCWSLLGESYSQAKSTMYKSSDNDIPNTLNDLLKQDAPIGHMAKILAAVKWSQDKEDEAKQLVCSALRQVQEENYFTRYLLGLDTFITSLKATENITEQQVHNIYQLVTMIAAVTGRSTIMNGFQLLATQPITLLNKFLPAMPENLYFLIPEKKNTSGNMMHTCPNGHPYLIDNCTQPVVEATCPCGAKIGGRGYKYATGNKKITIDENSQAGYKLNKDEKNVSDPADRISKQGVAVVQCILHACMLIGLQNEPNGILRMLGYDDLLIVQQYLVHQLLKNLQDLSESLGRNIDDALLIMHKILQRLLTQTPGPQAPDWSSMEERRTWEQTFRTHILLPIFQNLDTEIRNAQNTINEAENVCSMTLYKLVHDVATGLEIHSAKMSWDEHILWQIVDHSNSAHLLQVLRDSSGAQSVEVLQIILETQELGHVRYLESVLLLQHAAIAKYQNHIDLKDVEQKTLEDFVHECGHAYEKMIQEYIGIWNMIYEQLKVANAVKVLDQYFVRASINSPISIILPSARGRGQCAKLLARYLIDVQNSFLTKCKQVVNSSESISEVEVSQLSHSHFVCIDKQQDLYPLILMHTKYNITTDNQGRHHHTSYNIDALEKQIREKFVMYKKLIKIETLPCMQYPQDIGIGGDWDKLLANVQQQLLTAKIIQDVDRNVSRVHSSDVCEAVRTLTHAISFLAKVKPTGKSYLYEFLEKDLLLPATRTSIIPKSAQVEHTLTLYQRLSWHKAVIFSRQGLNPYKDALFPDEQEEILDEDVLERLHEAFERTDVMLLQQRLNEMLIKVPDISDCNWGLQIILPNIAFMGNGDDDSWYCKLPDEICFKHIVHLFTLAVQFTTNLGP